jgi:hypothetical protein
MLSEFIKELIIELYIYITRMLHWYWYICLLQLGWHPVAVVHYTFTHKQYTEQHNETEYTEYYVHNNKNT